MSNEATSHTAGHGHGDDHDHGVGHAVPLRILVAVAAALLLLTAITVYAAQFKFGPLEVVVAMTIATVKAALVCAYFMHLRYDKPFHAFVFISSLAFVSLFIMFAMLDAKQYAPEIELVEQQELSE